MCAKMWIVTHYPFSFPKERQGLSSATRDKLFLTSIQILEFWDVLGRNEASAKWGWLIRTYVQWHALVFVLAELCVSSPSPDYYRAWRTIETVYNDRVVENNNNQRGMFWKPLRRLMARAKEHKLQQENGSGSQPADGELNPPRDLPMNTQGVPSQHVEDETKAMQHATEAFRMDVDVGSTPTYNIFPDQGLSTYESMETPMSHPLWSSNDVQELFTNEQLMQQQFELLNWTGWNAGVGEQAGGSMWSPNDFWFGNQHT